MRGLYELIYEARQLDLVQLDVSYTKEQLMNKLAHYYRERDPTREMLLPQFSVMLARNVKDLPEEQLKEMLESSQWIAEEKLDGMRAKLHIGVSSNRIDTRHRSIKTYEYCERTAQLPHLQQVCPNWPKTVLDGELRMPVEKIHLGKTKTDSYLTSTTATVNSLPARAIEIQQAVGNCQYFAFDMLFDCGEDIRKLPYKERYAQLCRLTLCCPQHIKLPIRCTKGLEVFYKSMIAGGAEGIMLKDLNMPYIDAGPGGCRRPKSMYKMKKQCEVDCFITGFVPGKGEFSGLVGALLVSIVTKEKLSGGRTAVGQQEIGAIQPGDLAFRQKISEADGSLKDAMYGKVVKVNYLCKTKNNRMRHAVLDKDMPFRPDKTLYDCTEF